MPTSLRPRRAHEHFAHEHFAHKRFTRARLAHAFPAPSALLLGLLFAGACGAPAADEATADAATADAATADAATADAASTAGVVIATAADADALVPPLVATTAGKQVVDLLFDHLAEPTSTRVRTDGDAGFAPRLARRWQWSADSLSIAFELDAAARWHDGRPVTAADVQFSFALYTDPAVGSMHARGFDGIDSVTVRDARTAVAWWHRRHPEQFFQFVYNLAVMPKHLLDTVPRDGLLASAYASAPVGSGRYRFDAWERKRRLVLVADSGNYRGRPRFDRVIWSVAPDPNTATLAVLTGQADVLEVLRGDAVDKVAATPSLKTVEYGSLDYGYLALNHRPPRGRPSLFADRALRVALTQAIDRGAVVRNALDSLGRVALGPFTRSDATVDTTALGIAFDSAAAGRALDSLGWRRVAGNPVRMRNGQPLRFTILVPASSGTRRKLAVLLQGQLAAAGVGVEIEPVDVGVYASRVQQGDFEAALNAWRNDPSPSALRQAWGSPRGDDVGANFGRYASAAFDATIDSAITTFEPAARTALFRRAHALLVADAPAIWLYEPRNLAAVHTRLVPVGVRPDAWLAQLGDWGADGTRTAALR